MLTVALPMYKSENIGWLPLESLIRQQNVDFEWELIIAEEKTKDRFGKKRVMKYEERLKDSGCIDIKYKSLKDWISLPNKLISIANMSNEKSEVFLIQAADNYSHPRRLYEAYDHIINQEYDFIGYPYIYMFMIDNNEVYFESRKKDVTKMFLISTKTNYIKKLPMSSKKKGIDTWLYKNIKKITKNNTSKFIDNDLWKYGFATHGFHSISFNRYEKWKKNPKKFNHIQTGPLEIWPKDIIEKLQNIKNLTRK